MQTACKKKLRIYGILTARKGVFREKELDEYERLLFSDDGDDYDDDDDFQDDTVYEKIPAQPAADAPDAADAE